MKKRYFCILMAVLSVILLAACGNSDDSSQENSGFVRSRTDKVTQNSEESGGTQMQGIMIDVGGQSFQAILYDNETAKTLKGRLPLTLHMEELNGLVILKIHWGLQMHWQMGVWKLPSVRENKRNSL